MPYAIGAALLIALCWMPLKMHFEHKNRFLELLFKGLGTTTAWAFAAYRCIATGFAEPYSLWVFIGLTLCVAADIMLELRFTVGGVLFFLGHVCYVIALNTWGFTPYTLIVAAVAAAVLVPYLHHYRPLVPKGMLAPLTCYSIALCALLGFALPRPFLALSRQTVLMALGAALFVASDMTLCRNTLLKKGRRDQYISLLMYYLGQLLLALSVFPA